MLKNLPSRKTAKRQHLRVGRSSAGLGAFAAAPIKKGRTIAEYTGRRISGKAADKLYTKYLFEVDDDHVIDGAPKTNKARYINHGCRPNAEPVYRGQRVFIVAKKNIRAGEEVNYDYGKDYFDAFIGKRRCKCSACRKKRRARRRLNGAAQLS